MLLLVYTVITWGRSYPLCPLCMIVLRTVSSFLWSFRGTFICCSARLGCQDGDPDNFNEVCSRNKKMTWVEKQCITSQAIGCLCINLPTHNSRFSTGTNPYVTQCANGQSLRPLTMRGMVVRLISPQIWDGFWNCIIPSNTMYAVQSEDSKV